MRIQNSLKNMLFGLSGQIISAVMGFIVRTAFVYTLGIEYLGVDGLFTSILIMLSLANLGFDTAMIYSLYRPLAENDTYKVQALMNLYQKAYRLIGIIVLIIGLSLLPFLPYLMNGDTTINNINIIYILFLLNSVSSYYFVYKQSIIIADQRNHIISKMHSIFTILSNLIQILVLLTTENFIVVLSAQIAFRIIENIYIANKANKLYPYIKGKNNAQLSTNDKKLFFENLYALLLYRISGVVINGSGNIIMSVFIGIASVGVYSNYLLILNTLNTFLSHLFYSVTASIGNLNVKESEEKKYFIFKVLQFTNFWIYGFCAICLWSLVNPFIDLWIGKQYVFDQYIVLAIIVNFFTTGMQNASTTFRDTTGLFKKGKYRPIVAAIINIGVSIILVQKIGIVGVLLGSVISRLCTYFWYDPYVIFKFVFKRSVKEYFVRYLMYASIVFISAIITDIAGKIVHCNSILDIVIRGILSLIIPNLIFYLAFRKLDEFKYLWNIIGTTLNRTPFKQMQKKYNNM
ncbi:lipopolysaccharide biosynthesis protein [Gottfriedia solisilvae]|uniref:lipopolysaccharide biosynthesis protein n=1 Tax=Gottfriedia solisilvae TaxID=1516104 RepID=UPI003D2F5137